MEIVTFFDAAAGGRTRAVGGRGGLEAEPATDPARRNLDREGID